MGDGRSISVGQTIPIAASVGDARYCFPATNRKRGVKPAEMRLLCAGRERCLPSYHVERTDFQCRLVELVVEGHGKIRIRGKSHEIFPGITFCYGMDSQHEMWSSAEAPMTKYFAAFEAPASKMKFAGVQLATAFRWTRDLSTMQVLFDELIREGQRDGALHEEITSSYLRLILLKTAESLPDERIPNHKASQGRSVFERALLCIETRYCEINTLDELGAEVGVDPNYVCRLFKRFGDETPIQCLARHKLNHAAELLLGEGKPIAEIASIVGYADPFYFSKVFKKRFGKSPTSFRSGGQGDAEG